MYISINVALANILPGRLLFRVHSFRELYTNLHTSAKSPTYRKENLACRKQGLHFISLGGFTKMTIV